MSAKKQCTTKSHKDNGYKEGNTNKDMLTAGMSLFYDYVYLKPISHLSGKRRRTSQPSDDEDLSSLPTAGM